jgi:hypothetical protein
VFLVRTITILCLDVNQDEQLLVMRYIFLLLPDENRDVLESILRFLLDVSIRSGHSQVNHLDVFNETKIESIPFVTIVRLVSGLVVDGMP